MGRKRESIDGGVRDQTIRLRVSEWEKDIMEKQAQSLGYTSVSDFLREIAIWQESEQPCQDADCEGRVAYRLTCKGPWVLDREQARCDRCGLAYLLRLKKMNGPRVAVGMRPAIG